ncbi:MAG: GIN domain-containing protein [Eubacteriales bacterium]
MANIENFGAVVHEARKRAGLTQEAFASRLGITAQAVSKWENGLGYPDVTLFPDIAQVLDIPIEQLFGIDSTPGKIVPFPPKKDGLSFVFSHNNRGCYSSKEVERIDTEAHIAYFADGSTADCAAGMAVNRGVGEIRFFTAEVPEEVYDSGKTEYCREFGDFVSLTAKLSLPCKLEVKNCESGRGRVEATGSSKFIARIVTELSGDTLTVSFKSESFSEHESRNNRITVWIPGERAGVIKISISGSASCEIEEDCSILKASVSGSGDIKAANCNILECGITGSGSLKLGEAAFSSNISITGSGDVNAVRLCSPCVKITGSGSLEAKTIKGNGITFGISGSGDISVTDLEAEKMTFSVSGSGSMCCGGEVDVLQLSVGGFGDFDAKKLTVGEAHINTFAGNIVIGRIKRESHEKLGKEATLKVLARG